MSANPYESNKLSSKFIKWVITHCPNGIKRQFFIGSLAGLLCNSKLENKLLERIDSLLSLTTTGYTSLCMPVALKDVVWSNKDVLEEDINELKNSLKGKGINDNCIKNIIKSIPTWFKYDNDDNIFNDITNLIGELQYNVY